MSKHTPGQWFITGSMTRYIESRIGSGLVQEIAAVGPTNADNGYGDQQEANARLIAAAPDLLEALLIAKDTIPHIGGNASSVHSLIKTIEQAIAKATGEQQ